MPSVFKDLLRSTFGTVAPGAAKDLLSTGFIPPVPINPEQYTTPDGQAGWFFESAGGQYQYFKYNNFNSCTEAYARCPIVAAIVNRKALAMTNGKLWVLNSKDKVATSTQADKIRTLFNQPNVAQNRQIFEAQLYVLYQLFGFAIVLPIMPAGYTDFIDATSLWNIPPSWIDVQATEERFNRAGGITLSEIIVNFGGKKIPLRLDQLIIVRDIVPSFTMLTFPGNKISPLALPINNVIGAYESRNVLINYRGAMGILSQDPGKGQYVSTPMKPDEKTELERDFRRYGLRSRQVQVILTTASLKWQQMGYNTKELMLLEEVAESSKAICDGLGFPPHLMGLIDPTFNNQNTAEKFGLYQNNVIPDAVNIYEQLTGAFNLQNYNLHLDKDFSTLPVLQEDRKTLAEGRKILNEALLIEWRTGLITLNEWRVKLGEDPLPDDRGKLYYNEYVQQYGQAQVPTQEVGQGSAGSQQE